MEVIQSQMCSFQSFEEIKEDIPGIITQLTCIICDVFQSKYLRKKWLKGIESLIGFDCANCTDTDRIFTNLNSDDAAEQIEQRLDSLDAAIELRRFILVFCSELSSQEKSILFDLMKSLERYIEQCISKNLSEDSKKNEALQELSRNTSISGLASNINQTSYFGVLSNATDLDPHISLADDKENKKAKLNNRMNSSLEYSSFEYEPSIEGHKSITFMSKTSTHKSELTIPSKQEYCTFKFPKEKPTNEVF